MSFKRKIHFVSFIMFGFVAALLFFSYLATKAVEAADTTSKQKISLPLSVPEKNHQDLVSMLPVTIEGETVGSLVIYDDSTTQRPADYLEFYNNTGRLLAIGWFDRFGIERVAVDRGLLEEADELEGVFVVLLDGDFI